jgi:cholesterol transport system auxiliary component
LKCLRYCALALLVPVLALSAGCSGFLHSNAKAEQTYYLRSTATLVTTGVPLPAALRVASPGADPGLDTSRIVLLQPDHRMSFYTASRWPSPAPAMVEAMAVQTLRASGNWASVQDSASAFPSDFQLQVTLRRFEADYSGGATAAPEVHVVLDAILGRHDASDVVGAFEVAGTATAAANRMADVVSAFEQATNTALAQLAQHTLAAVRASEGSPPQNAVNPVPSSSR